MSSINLSGNANQITEIHILASTQSRIDFDVQNEDDIILLENALLCIRAICNLKSTSECITSRSGSLTTIINSFSTNGRILSIIFEILSQFIFAYDNDQYQITTTKKILNYMQNLDKKGQNGWKVIFTSLRNENNRDFNCKLSYFLSALLLIFCKNQSLFNEWYQEVDRIGLHQLISSRSNANSKFLQIFEFTNQLKNMIEHGISIGNENRIILSQNERDQLDQIMNQLGNDSVLTLKDPFFDLNRLQKGIELGNGGFGVVYLATMKETSKKYAVKTTKLQISTDRFSSRELFIFREINLMSSFNHPSVLRSIGYSPTNFEGEFFPTIIMEYCVNKSLRHIIDSEYRGQAPKGWDDTKKLINVYGIASGMKYLHQQKIIHRDLKPENILMDDYLCPKISDFGLSKLTQQCEDESMNIQSTLACKGTIRYMAPENFLLDYSLKSDVYAFSLIIYELLVGKSPFQINLDPRQYVRNVSTGIRPNFPDYVPDYCKNLIQRCWAQDPDDRPTFESIVNELKTNRSFITDSINESMYRDYIDYIDNYQSSFDLNKKHISFQEFCTGRHGDSTLESVNIDDA